MASSIKKEERIFFEAPYFDIDAVPRCASPKCKTLTKNKRVPCKECQSIYCSKKCFNQDHNGSKQCALYMDLMKMNLYVQSILLTPLSEEPDIYDDYASVSVADELVALAIHNKENTVYFGLLPEKEREEFVSTEHPPVDIVTFCIQKKGIPPSKKCAYLKPGANIYQELTGSFIMAILGCHFCKSRDMMAQLFLVLRLMCQMTDEADVKEPFLAVTQRVNSMKTELLKASPSALYREDNVKEWGARVYVFQLVPILEEKDFKYVTFLGFGVALYATKDGGILFVSAGFKHKDEDADDAHGFSAEELLLGNKNPHYDPTGLAAKKTLSKEEVELALKNLEGLANPESTVEDRAEILRGTLAVSSKIKFPLPIPLYRIVSARLNLSC